MSDERLQPKTEGSTLLSYTRFRGGLGHLKIEMMLRLERLEKVLTVRRTPYDGGEGLITSTELLNLEERCQFPDESEKLKKHKFTVETVVLETTVIKEIS